MKIQPYKTKDVETVLLIFRKNTPHYFAPEEEEDLLNYLAKEREDYYLLEVNGQIVGCGGINYFEKNKTARISWDFFDPDYQGKGYGMALLEFRLDRIRQLGDYNKVVVRTSQLASRFYEKGGFSLSYIKKNYWSDGLHLYFMERGV